MVVDQCWHRHELASSGRVDQRALGGGATVVRQVLERGTTYQCGSGRGDQDLGAGGEGAVGGDEVGLVPYRIVVGHPCMVRLEIRRLQSRH